MIDWDRRRRNIKILCAAHEVTATQVALEMNMSPNTLTKFLNAKTPRGISQKTLALVLEYFNLSDESDLDTDNPLSDPKIALRRIIDDLSPEQAIILNRELQARFTK
jgi:transcriptional regulator with XRE-family HTH domain